LAIFSAKGIVISYLPMIVTLPFQATLITVIYLNLRISKEEGMNAAVLTRDLRLDSMDAIHENVDGSSEIGGLDVALLSPNDETIV
jgi:hypothetical protein